MDNTCIAVAYNDLLPELEAVQTALMLLAENAGAALGSGCDRNPIEHYKVRIKSPESTADKAHRNNIVLTSDVLLEDLHDLVGLRIVCTFVDCIYSVANYIRSACEVVEEKDYIASPKANGYRSLHLILRFPAQEGIRAHTVYAEVQLRTIAMDCWASLEHQLKYKRSIRSRDLIVAELKRCANELASADITMQTIHEMIEQHSGHAENKMEENCETVIC